MAKVMNSPLLISSLILSLIFMQSLSMNVTDDPQVYIVYMGSTTEKISLTSEHYLGILQQHLDGSVKKEILVRSYTRSFNGFAANLTEKESEKLKNVKGVVSVFPSRTLELQTTRSWDFMGFSETVVPSNKSVESNIIIGVIDSGIYPESPSFNDEGFGPPPKKWRGSCKGGTNFTCNNKLIGAWTAFKSARDKVGHGTHTASTAAGRHVENASFFGIAEGIARGAVPSARIAVYHVCALDSCEESDILAGFDEAIADGVDLITISIGGNYAVEMDVDSIAIGAFHATKKGILTMQAAGNSGNDSASVSSIAPWLFTVGASTMDRHIVTKAVLGNGNNLTGNSINPLDMKEQKFPLVYGKEVSSSCSQEDAMMCTKGCLNKDLKGKIVVCDTTDMDYSEASKAGVSGVLTRTSINDLSFIMSLPAIEFDDHNFDALMSYHDSTRTPIATILKSESFNDTAAPVVASFSSRGPNVIASDILKPDITAPGVEILAAYSPEAPVNGKTSDIKSVRYSILSGTSMSCPHVAGASAYVKSIHPDWSPSAIKSALMTTARPMSPLKNSDAEFSYGSGHLDPVKATNPGLVYETTEDDYMNFLCNLGYTEQRIGVISGNKSFTCPKQSGKKSSPNDLNYPSMSVAVTANKPYNIKFSRTITNVGVANSTYIAKVESKKDFEVIVTPNSLSFTSLQEKKVFNVTVVGNGSSTSPISTSLVWSDGYHFVRSPIVVYIRKQLVS